MSRFGSTAVGSANGLSPRVDNVRQQLGIMLPGEGEAASLTTANKYDRLAVTAAGLAPDGSTTFRFFQNAFAAGTTNIRQPGKLSQNGLVLVKGIGFHIDPVGDNELDDDLTGADVSQALKKFLNGGYIRLEKNQRLVMDDFGLFKYPAGGGAFVTGGVTTTASTTSQAGWPICNGFPSHENRHRFPSPIVFTPNDVCELSVNFPTAIALAGSSTGVLMATLWAEEVFDSDR